jgi:hypothetical protein
MKNKKPGGLAGFVKKKKFGSKMIAHFAKKA